MAIYEYICEEHGVFERLVKMSDSDKPQPCPACGKEYPRNEIISSSGSFQLKGDWFKTKGTY
jgi:putative FmdB family regulatory protein